MVFPLPSQPMICFLRYIQNPWIARPKKKRIAHGPFVGEAISPGVNGLVAQFFFAEIRQLARALQVELIKGHDSITQPYRYVYI